MVGRVNDKLRQAGKRMFENFMYFYTYLGNRIFVSIFLSFSTGILDGFGLAMFIPLLQMVSGEPSPVGADQMGNLSFIVDLLRGTRVELTLQSILIVILVFFSLKGLVKFIEGYYRVVLEQRFIRMVRFSNIELLSSFQFRAFVTTDSGRIQNTFSGEVEKVAQAYRAYFMAFQYGTFVAVYVFLAFMTNARFAVLVACGGVLTNFAFSNIFRITKKLSLSVTQEAHNFQGLLIQKVANFKYLKASGLIYDFAEKLKKSVLGIEASQKRIGLLASFLTSSREPLVILVVVVVILIQVKLFDFRLGPIILSLLFFYRSLTFLMAMQNWWNSFLAVSGSLANLSTFKQELRANQDKHGAVDFSHFKDSLRLDRLNFSYDASPFIHGVTLSILKNQTVALVGESGSGKTTLLNILGGLLPVSRGQMFVDAVDACDLDVRGYQKRIGYITQEPVIFNDTIFNNVSFWADPSEENKLRFEQALKLASIYDFVVELDEKEETRLGNSGITLSGGQRQRISIARELFKDVDFLFMDEATSALDSETERSIQENLENLRGKFTIVIIAHRLSTIKDADQIFFFSNGTIEMQGNFEELKNRSPRFNEMVKLQMV